MKLKLDSPLDWEQKFIGGTAYYEVLIGDFDGGDGVRFSWVTQPTCHRRGTHKLLIEVNDRNKSWGCFDESDQPMRYYHSIICLLTEADAIARVLLEERKG